MKNEELGIDDKGNHNPRLTSVESKCLEVLQSRGEGGDAAISAHELAEQVVPGHYFVGLCPDMDLVKRHLRKLINHLIMSHQIPIICQAGFGGGYYLAGAPGEVDQFYRTFHRRAMTGLLKASRGKKAAFVQIAAQLVLGFDDPESQAAIEKMKLTPDADAIPAWIQMTTKMLDRISADPQRYAAEIRQIQTAYGEIFVPREKVANLKRMTADFQQLLSEIV